MLITVKNIKIQNNKFIDNIYFLYHTLLNKQAFTTNGFETKGFKIWKFEQNYYILDKTSGIIVTWYKLLGWYLASNVPMKDSDWEVFCKRLKDDMEANDIEIYSIADVSMEEEDALL